MNVRVDSCHKLFNMACLPWAQHGLLDFIHNPKVPPKISRYKKQSCMVIGTNFADIICAWSFGIFNRNINCSNQGVSLELSWHRPSQSRSSFGAGP